MVTEIERQVNTAMGKAIDSATKLLNERVKEATDIAVIKMKEGSEALMKETRKAKDEIEKAKDEIRFESGFRKFMFWLSPVLLLAQSIAIAILLLR